MDIKGFVEKAKQAAAAAGDVAREVATAASEQAQVALAAAPQGEAAGVLADGETPAAAPAKTAATDTFAGLKELGSAKLQELIASFQQALPAIKTAGYELTEFEIELGVPPKLIPHFRYAAKSAADIERARDAVRDNKLGGLILNGLLKAGDVHKQIRVAGYCFSHVEIELGLIPSVRLQYKNEPPAPSLEALPALLAAPQD